MVKSINNFTNNSAISEQEYNNKIFEASYQFDFDSDNFRQATKENIQLLKTLQKMGAIVGFKVVCKGLKQKKE